MNKKLMSKGLNLFIWLLFILYFAIMIYVVLLKSGSALTMSRTITKISFMQKVSSINFIPFKTIFYYLVGNQIFVVAVRNILGNILAFSPLGFFIPILFNKYKKLKNIFFISVAVSLSIEIVQFLFNLGSSDIDDIILNVLGSVLGFGVYKVFSHIKKS